MVNFGNGAGVALRTTAGPWRQHWSVLTGTFIQGLVLVSIIGGAALYAERLWLALLAPVALIPSLLAYARWQRRRLFLTPTELIIESGVATTRAVSFPLHDIDVMEARQTLLGKVFDYGDIAIFSGLQAQDFQKLHPFSRFMAVYQVCRRASAGWPEPDRRWLPPPAFAPLPGPRPREPQRAREHAIDTRYRRPE